MLRIRSHPGSDEIAVTVLGGPHALDRGMFTAHLFAGSPSAVGTLLADPTTFIKRLCLGPYSEAQVRYTTGDAYWTWHAYVRVPWVLSAGQIK